MELSLPTLQLDTCNDQNTLAVVLRVARPSSRVCGWYFAGRRFANSHASSVRQCKLSQGMRPSHTVHAQLHPLCVWISLLDPQRFVTATPWLVTSTRSVPSVHALHWTGFWGGHTFAKLAALRALGMGEAADPACSRLVVPAPDTLSQMGEDTHGNVLALTSLLLVAQVALALLTRRAVAMPDVPCALHPLGGTARCGLHYFTRLDPLLELHRALNQRVGAVYWVPP